MSDYNAFIQANTNVVRVYVPKSVHLNGGSVLAPYQITRGTLPSIAVLVNDGGVLVSDIALGEGSLYHKILLHMERFLYQNASAYQGQSQEIIDHIQTFGYEKPHFLYRNLQPLVVVSNNSVPCRDTFKIVYAGLLGVAQNILSIVKHINFKELGAELHIYGGGNQATQIQQFVNQHDCGIKYHGYQPKETINSVLGQYHASIIPLSVRIKGAVPSKIFDLLPHGIPILFSGGGEGENIIKAHGFLERVGRRRLCGARREIWTWLASGNQERY